MTPNEAHEYMENEIRCIRRSKVCDRNCFKCELVKEDKPLIEAYGVAILAIEKQIPKRVIHTQNHHQHFCSTCHHPIKVGKKYCGSCGQALKWGEN